MGSLDSNRLGLILRELLVEPLNKRRFNAFYSVTYQFTFGYLRFLSYRGYRLPVDDRTDCDPLSDIAIDILGGPLESGKGLPFKRIFGYFHTIGIDDFRSADPKVLWDRFAIWLRKQIKQELGRLGVERNSQIGNLKRRFNDIFNTPEYTSLRAPGDHTECVALAANRTDLRSELPPVPADVIREIAEKAFLRSLNRAQWCQAVFNIMNEMIEYQNSLKKHQLLAAVVAVNAEYVEASALPHSPEPSPKVAIIRKTIEETRLATMSNIEKDVLPRYMDKGTISKDEAAKLLLACDAYLLDWCSMGETDLKPAYFRQFMPEQTHGQVYLDKYKNIFETLICKAEEDFRNRVRNNPIIRGFGDYLFNE